MVFLQRSRLVNPRKRPHPPPNAEGPGTAAAGPDPGPSSAVDAAAALLADAGCTLLVPPHQTPSLPSPHAFAARLGRALSADPSAAPRLLAGVAAFADDSPARSRQLLLPTAAPHAPSLARALLSVPAIQPGLLTLLLEKLPEHFHDGGALGGLPLQDDVGRLIVSQFRWLDFLVDADAFVEKLVEVLSVAPPRLKKEIIGSLPEIVGDKSHATVVAALQKLLQEDSEVVVAVLDVLSDLNLNEDLQEQKKIQIGCSKAIISFLRKRLGQAARKLLTTDHPREDTENGWRSKGDLIQKILQIYLGNGESTSDLLDELHKALTQVPLTKTPGTQGVSSSFPTLCSSTIPSWYRVLHEENTGSLNKMIKQGLKTRALAEIGSTDTILGEIQKSVEVFVSLIQMCKTHEKVSIHAMAVKHGGKYVDTFVKAFNLLEREFKDHNAIILKMLKELQKATRTIQTICSEAKCYKRTMITSKVPPAKRSMERFLFQVKALLHNCSTEKKFCMGNLKHKDLQGHVVSSQVYGSVDDEDETDSDTPADENDNAMDEDVVEGSNETPMEEE